MGARARLAAFAVVAAAATANAVGAGPAQAYWSDQATAVAGSSSGLVLTPPASATCSSGLGSVTTSWPDVDSRYRYAVTMYRVGPPRTASAGPTLLAAGATSVTYGSLELTTGIQYEIDIRSVLAVETSWQSVSVLTSPRFSLLGCS